MQKSEVYLHIRNSIITITVIRGNLNKYFQSQCGQSKRFGGKI